MSASYMAWKGWTGAFGEFRSEDALYFRMELAKSGLQALRGKNILEIGFGNGALAGWLRSEGACWRGVEVSQELVDKARAAGFAAHHELSQTKAEIPPGTLDALLAFDVLEHLPLHEIGALLEQAKSCLKDDGVIVARLPSGDSPFSGAIFWGDLTHRTLLGSSAVEQLARDHGYRVLEIRSPVLPIRGLGFLRGVRRWFIGILQRLTYAYVRHALMGNARAVVSPNLVVVMRKAGANETHHGRAS